MAYNEVIFALSDSTRNAVFERLREGPQTVSALAAGLPVSRPAISQHLKVLKAAGLVADQADGARRLYRINPGGLSGVCGYLNAIREEALAMHQAEIARQIEERRYA